MTIAFRVDVPDEASAVVSAYLDLVDSRLPECIDGFYLTGSLALDDYRSGHSDIDFVAVTHIPLTPFELRKLDQLHREFRRTASGPELDGVYVTWHELQTSPVGLSAPYCRDGRFFFNSGFAANPVTWLTLHRYPISVRGPMQPEVAHDEMLLRVWCCQNLQSYWKEWMHAARTNVVRCLFSLSRQAMVWGVLGVTRLHATIRTGDILSKSAAGRYALETFPLHWLPIAREALEARCGGSSLVYRNPFVRRRDVLAFMEYVISDAAR
jgi:hypothetical protein